MILSVLMLAQAATAAPPPPAQDHVVPIFSPNDYPKIAVENGWSGTARADLTISAAGTVTACKIVQSTGHRLLDDYVCSSLMRAKFTPAKDENGKAVEGHFSTPPINFNLRN